MDAYLGLPSLKSAPQDVSVANAPNDPVSRQIQSKLGDFTKMKQFLDINKGMMGVDQGFPVYQTNAQQQQRHHSSITNSANSASRLQPAPESRPEFKKPHHHPSHNHQRGGYVKPADGKPPYEGRGGYPGQPVKHGSGIANHRSNGILPAKGPPLGNPPQGSSLSSSSASSYSSSTSRQVHHGTGSRPNHIPYDQDQGSTTGPRESLPSATPAPADMENIFNEMIVRQTPLTAIEATPRTEMDNKFIFNPALAKLTERTPAPSVPTKSK
ncbi:hypothetical protein HHI36_011290 [Cryptolaemus montrouzieri]|uniref:Uncharacterized protein n=1 Tax=Cryptolaemus montrouzieri TaxID=559131 RepID=A0ABD2ML84_9CUCU